MLDVFRTLKDRVQGRAPKGAKRSPWWLEVRGEHIERFPYCAVCGGDTKLEVHHIVPFHVAPDLELEPDNLLTLCRRKKHGIDCHLLIGHLGNFRRINPSVLSDAAEWNSKLGTGRPWT